MSKLFLGSDHAGFALKNAMTEHLRTAGYDVEDLGAHTLTPDDDYPDFVTPFAERVAADPTSFGIFFGGSGEGEAMCANRVKGIRAGVFYGPMQVTEYLEIEGGRSEDGYDIVRLPRRHQNANVLSIGARFISAAQADEAIRVFLATTFSNDSRHVRRMGKF